MSTMRPELSPIPLPAEKPSNRGKFSPDRDLWEQVHYARFVKWQLGSSVDDIAHEESVTSNAIRHSLAWCEARLPKGEVIAARQIRLRLQAFARLSSRYLDELEALMSDPNPVIRSRALDHFRKTVALEGGGGVQVNVNAASIVRSDLPRSFEEMLDAIKGKIVEEPVFRNPLSPNCPAK